jgi:tRNA (guanine-N7-)-methyltransferase
MSRRIRKHVNPFNVQARLGVLDRMAIFGREAPVEVDLGCAGAGFLWERAQNHPERDFVGLEVRKPLVEAVSHRIAQAGLPNLRVFHANASENLALAEPGVICGFHVHFPDPCFKKRHHKRRLLQPKTVRAMANLLPIEGFVHAQSDVKPLAEEMERFLATDGAFDAVHESLEGPKPLPETTEWERQHLREGEPIYRMLFVRKRTSIGEVTAPEFADIRPPDLGQTTTE